MQISFQAALTEIKSRFEILAVISKYLSVKKSGSGYVSVCPFHNDKSPSLHISPSKGIYKCFACGASGDFLKFLTEYKRISFSEAVHELAQELGLEIITSSPKEASPLENLFLELHQAAAEFYTQQLALAENAHLLAYLQKRQIKPETRQTFGLGYSPARQYALYEYIRGLPTFPPSKASDRDLIESGLFVDTEKGVLDRFRNRLMFPIRNAQGQVIAFGGRTLSDQQPKYLNSPESLIYRKGWHLYGFDLAQKQARQSRKIILLEGYFDVIQAHQAGLDFAVGSLGTALTSEQAGLLYQSNLNRQIFLAFDNDEAGDRALESALNVFQSLNLAHTADLKVISFDQHKDIDEYLCDRGIDSFLKLLESAPPAHQAWLKTKTRDIVPEDGEARRKALQTISQGLSTLKDPLMLELLAEETARLLSFAKSTVLQTLQKAQPTSKTTLAVSPNRLLKPPYTKSTGRKGAPTSDAAKTIVALLFLTLDESMIAQISTASLNNPELEMARTDILQLAPTERYQLLRKESSDSPWQELLEVARWNEEHNLEEILRECLQKLSIMPKYQGRRRLNRGSQAS